MIYLSERQIGFDADEIGFPSVGGCRAVVLVTAGGLFGYHLNGSLDDGKKHAFVSFVNIHRQGNLRRTLYVASMEAGAGRFLVELRDIANGLGYKGTLYWAHLASVVTEPSAYVHFQDIGHHTCGITARNWSNPIDDVPANKGAYVADANHAIANGLAPAQMFINLDQAGLRTVYPHKV
jgi:hypothetical protein